MFNRVPEDGLFDVLKAEGVGSIAFSPLANGLLTGRYLNGLPADSRAVHDPRYLKPDSITPDKLDKIRALNSLALERGQSLAQLALQWVLRESAVTSALIGASKPAQIIENIEALRFPPLTEEELKMIDNILA